MQTLANRTTADINAEYERLLRAMMAGEFPQSKTRYFYALRAEWRKRQELYNN